MAWDREARTSKRHWLAFGMAVMLPALLGLPVSPASGQTPAAGFSGLGGANSKKPIDIESDRLEVDDKSHLAIFIGNVSATQGDNNLKAPRLEVFYESGNQPAAPDKRVQQPKPAKAVKPAGETASSDPISSGQIKLIHALGGKVVVTSTKDQQEAVGDDAIYDVKAQLITMTGKEVILVQKQNKVKGTKLIIDLATGRATVMNEETASSETSGKKRRIQAVFQQEGGKGGISINPFGEDKKKGEAPPPQPAATAPEAAPGSAWRAQSR